MTIKMHRIIAGTPAARKHMAKNGKIHGVHRQAPDIEIHNKMVEIKKKEKLQRRLDEDQALRNVTRIEGR